jgi:hypothetical protein
MDSQPRFHAPLFRLCILTVLRRERIGYAVSFYVETQVAQLSQRGAPHRAEDARCVEQEDFGRALGVVAGASGVDGGENRQALERIQPQPFEVDPRDVLGYGPRCIHTHVSTPPRSATPSRGEIPYAVDVNLPPQCPSPRDTRSVDHPSALSSRRSTCFRLMVNTSDMALLVCRERASFSRRAAYLSPWRPHGK